MLQLYMWFLFIPEFTDGTTDNIRDVSMDKQNTNSPVQKVR